MDGYTIKDTCRVCESKDLVQVLDLGSTPPANAYVEKHELEKNEASFPLVLYLCRDCSLLQLRHVVDPSILFKNYHYATGASPQLLEHFGAYAKDAILPLIESPQDLVVDIGGNDGVLLSFVKDHARVLNVDPADNLAPLSEERGVPFYPAFFNSEVAKDIVAKHGVARVVTANNVMAHTDPLRDVCAGVSTLIGGDGMFIFEVHWQKHLLEETAFDQIYHEHLCFHSLHNLMRLVESAGMQVYDVKVVPSQGQSLRVFAAKNRPVEDTVTQLLEEEKKFGISLNDTYSAFAGRVETGKRELQALLREIQAEGKRVVGYGAPAKATTLCSAYGIDNSHLEYIVDDAPLKHGRYMPGTHIPIRPSSVLKDDAPDYILLLVWNFKDSILAKERELREKGVKFIITVPKVKII